MDASGRFQQVVTSAEELVGLMGEPSELAVKKQHAELDRHMIDFIAESPFLLIGTFSLDGRCDVSPRGDATGAVKVLDPRMIVIPDRPGNRRADSLRNILQTGRIGLLFLVPGLGETLRVNGRACVFQDRDVLSACSVQGKQPALGIGVEVEECFLQCAKAVIRSQLWRGAPPPLARPSFAQILLDQTQIAGQSVESLTQAIEESYAQRLY